MRSAYIPNGKYSCPEICLKFSDCHSYILQLLLLTLVSSYNDAKVLKSPIRIHMFYLKNITARQKSTTGSYVYTFSKITQRRFFLSARAFRPEVRQERHRLQEPVGHDQKSPHAVGSNTAGPKRRARFTEQLSTGIPTMFTSPSARPIA